MGLFSSSFDPERNMQDLTGKVALITGGNSGSGFYTALHLGRKGAKVYLAARSQERANAALEKLRKEAPDSTFSWLPMDLSDLESVKKAAKAFLDKEDRLDILVLHAGVLPTPFDTFQTTKYGISQELLVNYVGPYLLRKLLLPILKETAKIPDSDVRIVTVASGSQFMAKATDPNLKIETKADLNQTYKNENWYYSSFNRYSVSKMANAIVSRVLQEELNHSSPSIICIALHPGAINSFSHRIPGPQKLWEFLLSPFFYSGYKGSFTSCWAAASPEVRQNVDKYKGKYVEPVGKLKEFSANAKREDLAKGLIRVTEELLEEFNM